MTRFFTLLLFSLFIVACGGPEGEAVETADAEEVPTGAQTVEGAQYNVDPAASNVEWEGSKLVGGSHTGTIPIVNGQLMVTGDRIVGGRFTMDISKLENTDLGEADGRDKLVGHLKSGDFFDVEKYPMANFTITNVQPVSGREDNATHTITGNLQLKDVTKSVTLPAIVSIDGSQLKASTPEFVIDRKQWNMEYGSGSIAGIAQDNIINDEVGLQLYVVANR